jgi:hypothetical protein
MLASVWLMMLGRSKNVGVSPYRIRTMLRSIS